MTYKVLLADDEILDLQGMQTFIPWNDLGMVVTDAVNSGFAALEVMEREQIDILITDIHMPNMTGLELARRALEMRSELRIIFISGYKDFNYVKQAISLKAVSYVLKPMDDEELIQSLKKIKQELDEDLRRRETEHASLKVIPILRTLDIQLDRLFRAVESYDLVGVHDELDSLFSLTAQLQSRFSVHNFATYMMMKLDSFLHTLNEDLLEILGMELGKLDVLLQFETIDEIQTWLRRRLFEISELLANKMKNQNSKLIREVIQYVRNNLSENVTLRQLADRFSFSPNYLGHIFKDQTGKNYSEFVIGLRMEKARELLGNPTVKVYEVAGHVGYRYLPYFNRQFKETYGMTPNEYRRKR